MNNRPRNIDQIAHDRRGSFGVPDGYFSTLTSKLTDIPYAPEPASRWAGVKSLTAFAVSFTVLVIIGFTGYRLTNQSTLSVEDENFAMLDLYNISAEEIIESQAIESQAIEVPNSSQLYADAAIEQLEYLGINITEIEE